MFCIFCIGDRFSPFFLGAFFADRMHLFTCQKFGNSVSHW